MFLGLLPGKNTHWNRLLRFHFIVTARLQFVRFCFCTQLHLLHTSNKIRYSGNCFMVLHSLFRRNNWKSVRRRGEKKNTHQTQIYLFGMEEWKKWFARNAFFFFAKMTKKFVVSCLRFIIWCHDDGYFCQRSHESSSLKWYTKQTLCSVFDRTNVPYHIFCLFVLPLMSMQWVFSSSQFASCFKWMAKI